MSTLSLREEGDWEAALHSVADEVKEDWQAFDVMWEDFRQHHSIELRRDAGGRSRQFLLEAFAITRARNLLRALAIELRKHDLVRDRFDDRLRPLLPPTAWEVHGFVNDVFTPVDAMRFGAGLLRACDHVCRIDIDGQHAGTGVLVHRDLVATAAHVVWDLIARQPRDPQRVLLRADGSLQQAQDTVGRLTLTFGTAEDYLEDLDRNRTYTGGGRQVAALHEDWLAWGSAPTPTEHPDLVDVRDLAGIAVPDGPWDLALIRLAEARALPDGSPFEEHLPRNPFAITVLHHPASGTDRGQLLLLSNGTLDQQLGDPPVRSLHDANTLRGSSGAPIYNDGWKIVALHQGGPRVFQHHSDRAKPADRNRAVPVRHWCTRLGELRRVPGGPTAYLTHLRHSPDPAVERYPVIGRRETQHRVWRALQPDATPQERLLIVRGDPGTGQRFTKRLVAEVVTSQRGLIAALDVANVRDTDAAGFAQRVIAALSGHAVVRTDDGFTTRRRDARDQVVPTLSIELQRLANGKPTFVVLEGFGATWLDDAPVVDDLIADLIEHLADVPVLRLVLVGWPVDPPDGFATCVEELLPPTAEDVARWLVPRGGEPDGAFIGSVTALLDAQHQAGLSGYDAAHSVIRMLAPVVMAALRNMTAVPATHVAGDGP